MITLPNGSEYGPLINVFMGFPPNFNGDRDRNQAIPSNAPSGNYTYDAYVGIYPVFVWDEDHFAFGKSATDNGASIVSDWENWGESFEDITGISEFFSPESFLLHEAYPNPFNPTTSIEYDLVESVNVHLAVMIFPVVWWQHLLTELCLPALIKQYSMERTCLPAYISSI